MTLTLGLTYLALVNHEQNRQAQSDVLRAQTRVLNSLSQDLSSPSSRAYRRARERDDVELYPPSRAEQAARHRAHFIETAKEKWNSEVEGAVRWVQNTDWADVREATEDTAARLLGLPTSTSAPGEGRTAGQVADAVRREVVEDARQTAQYTKRTFEHTKESVRQAAASAATQVREDVGIARSAVAGAVERGIQKGREAVGRAKAAVHMAEERLETRMDAKLLHLSEVERALSQRYEKSDVMSKSVEEILRERYIPIDKRDNTKLRGL